MSRSLWLLLVLGVVLPRHTTVGSLASGGPAGGDVAGPVSLPIPRGANLRERMMAVGGRGGWCGQCARLRGGGVDPSLEEKAGQDLDTIYDSIRDLKEEFMAGMEGGEDGLPTRYSAGGLPMGDDVNPELVEKMPNNFYEQQFGFGDAESEQDEGSDDFRNMDRWIPTDADLKEAMNMLDYAKDYVDGLSPDGIDALCKKNNCTIEDMHPGVNSFGKGIANLTRLEEVRQRAIKRMDDIQFTHDLLRQHMNNPNLAPTGGELIEEELAAMTELDVNPAVKLLHEWEQNKKHEHKTGQFEIQNQAREEQPVEPVAAPKTIPEPVAPIAAPPLKQPLEAAQQ